MPENISNKKGSLMLGYLEGGSEDEHLQVGGLYLFFCSPCIPLQTSHPLITDLSRASLG